MFAGASRTAFETYLPAMLTAGALCLVAAMLILTIDRERPVLAEPRPA
jgi:hypothetical protein